MEYYWLTGFAAAGWLGGYVVGCCFGYAFGRRCGREEGEIAGVEWAINESRLARRRVGL